MIWYDPLFLGTGCPSKLKALRRRITNRKAHPGVYLITLPPSGQGTLEIIPSALLLQRNYPAEALRIIGMAGSRGEALNLTQDIISECFGERGDTDIGAYLRESGRDPEVKSSC